VQSSLGCAEALSFDEIADTERIVLDADKRSRLVKTEISFRT
jgi:hypothetical protein